MPSPALDHAVTARRLAMASRGGNLAQLRQIKP
jgi:hypothetical protein